MKKTILAAIAASLLCLVSPTFAAAQPIGVEVSPRNGVDVRIGRERDRSKCKTVVVRDERGRIVRDDRGRPVTERRCKNDD